jgi:membrane-associated phospholipid phosphatase
MHWLLQVIVGGVVVAITLYIINQMFEYIGKILESFSS